VQGETWFVGTTQSLSSRHLCRKRDQVSLGPVLHSLQGMRRNWFPMSSVAGAAELGAEARIAKARGAKARGMRAEALLTLLLSSLLSKVKRRSIAVDSIALAIRTNCTVAVGAMVTAITNNPLKQQWVSWSSIFHRRHACPTSRLPPNRTS